MVHFNQSKADSKLSFELIWDGSSSTMTQKCEQHNCRAVYMTHDRQTYISTQARPTSQTLISLYYDTMNESLQTRQQAMFPLHQATDGHVTIWWPQYDHIWSVADFTSSITTRGLCSKNVELMNQMEQEAKLSPYCLTAHFGIRGRHQSLSCDHGPRGHWLDRPGERRYFNEKDRKACQRWRDLWSITVGRYVIWSTDLSGLMKFADDERNVANNKIILVMYIELIRCAWRRTKTNKWITSHHKYVTT